MTDATADTVICRREGTRWVLEVPAVDGAATQADNLDQVPFMAAGLIEGLSGRVPDRLRLVGGGIAEAYASRGPQPDGDALAAALGEGFPPPASDADRALLAEQIERFGHWTCAVDDDEVFCTRR